MTTKDATEHWNPELVDVTRIIPNPFQVRLHCDREAVDGLVRDIQKRGLMQVPTGSDTPAKPIVFPVITQKTPDTDSHLRASDIVGVTAPH